MSVRQLAHELNSLLDGSIRLLALAERDLREGEARLGDGTGGVGHLTAAREGLRRMAELLRRAIEGEPPALDLLRTSETLGSLVPRLVEALRPVADEARVEVSWRVDEEAAALPAGLLEPVVMNGLRNAIEAAGATGRPLRRVALDTALDRGTLIVRVSDTGAGPGAPFRPLGHGHGHGVGLALCREIVALLGGRLELTDGPGGGAVLRVEIPAPERGSRSEAA